MFGLETAVGQGETRTRQILALAQAVPGAFPRDFATGLEGMEPESLKAQDQADEARMNELAARSEAVKNRNRNAKERAKEEQDQREINRETERQQKMIADRVEKEEKDAGKRRFMEMANASRAATGGGELAQRRARLAQEKRVPRRFRQAGKENRKPCQRGRKQMARWESPTPWRKPVYSKQWAECRTLN